MLARLSALALAGSVLGACGGGGGGDAGAGAAADSAAPAAAPAAPAAPAAAPAAAGGGAAAGQQIFTSTGNCYTCHGPTATGTALAPNLTDAEWLNFPSRPSLDDVMGLVRTGVPQPKQHPAPMPPMGGAQLTDQQIHDVAEYVLSLSAG
jgi:mono/diheme cytochrome c family protein